MTQPQTPPHAPSSPSPEPLAPERKLRLLDWHAAFGDPLERRARGKRLAPSPPGHWFVGQFPSLRPDPLAAAMRWRREVGDAVRLHVGGMSVHMLFHPDAARRVLQEHARNYTKQTRGFDKIREFLGNGLLTSEGSFWLRQRRIAQPAFHRQKLAGFAGAMVRAALATAERWEARARDGAPTDVSEDMMALTLRVVGEALFSADTGGEAESVGRAVDELLGYARRTLLQPWSPPQSWPTAANRRVRDAQAKLDAIVLGLIRGRREAKDKPEDLLTMLMETRDEETGERMDDRQLRDEVMTTFLAGHETTANALAWTFYLLSLNPWAARALRDELRAVLRGAPPTMDDLPKLPYTRLVVQESLRLYPPAYIIGRMTAEDDELGGYHVPAGGLVFVSPYVTQRHPDFWPNPEGFDPERFLPERSAGRPAFAYFPFGGGPRLCIGNNFALMEAQLVLATLAQRFSPELCPGRPVVPSPAITLRFRDGLWMTVRAEA